MLDCLPLLLHSLRSVLGSLVILIAGEAAAFAAPCAVDERIEDEVAEGRRCLVTQIGLTVEFFARSELAGDRVLIVRLELAAGDVFSEIGLAEFTGRFATDLGEGCAGGSAADLMGACAKFLVVD